MKQSPLDPVNYRLQSENFDEDFPQLLEVLSNVPDSPALIPLPIERAGISKQSVYLQLPGIVGEQSSRLPVLCEVEAASNLNMLRGVHMSRFEEFLFRIAASEDYDSIDSFAKIFAHAIREAQHSVESSVSVKGAMLVPRLTSVSKKTSHDRVTLLADAHLTENTENIFTGIEAFNVTACPCTQTFTKFSVVPELRAKGFTPDQVNMILDTVLSGTHLQRGTVSLRIEKTTELVRSENLFQILDKATHLVFDLLKRPDEHALVIRALKRPQFTEDVVREITATAFLQLGELVPAGTRIDVRSELQDSIHIHDVFSQLRTSFGEIDRALR